MMQLKWAVETEHEMKMVELDIIEKDENKDVTMDEKPDEIFRPPTLLEERDLPVEREIKTFLYLPCTNLGTMSCTLLYRTKFLSIHTITTKPSPRLRVLYWHTKKSWMCITCHPNTRLKGTKGSPSMYSMSLGWKKDRNPVICLETLLGRDPCVRGVCWTQTSAVWQVLRAGL